MERREILAQIQRTLEPNGIGRFCFVCGAPNLHTEASPQGEIFVCDAQGHRSPRAFLFDGRAIYSFEDGELVHVVTGAVIGQGRGETRQTLLFLRRKFPFLYTIPAGHVEIGMDAEEEMRREIQEETGLTISTAARLWDSEIRLEDPCRRGANFHRWHVFQVTAHGVARLSDEGRIIGWYRDDEIRALGAQDLLTRPTHSIFQRLGILD